MSATSGIGVSPELSAAWTAARSDKSVRFLKVAIENEALVLTTSIKSSKTLDDDFTLLEPELAADVPAYVLARIDDGSGWMAISYVPDHAKVREKMLYASTRTALTKALGSTNFPASLFATSKSDLGRGAYSQYLAAQAAPVPLSAREKELLSAREAERAAGAAYDGARARVSPLQHSKGLRTDDKVAEAIESLADAREGTLAIINVDVSAETLVLASLGPCTADELGGKLPAATPCYAFFAHPLPDVAQTVFIYSCPSGSPVRQRMLYSSQALILATNARAMLAAGRGPLAPRKIETSEPASLGTALLRHELIHSDEAKAAARASASASRVTSPMGGGTTPMGGSGEVEQGGNVSSVRGAIAALEGRTGDANAPAPATQGFARPKGPGRKR